MPKKKTPPAQEIRPALLKTVQRHILLVRGARVMLDRDLAAMFGVPTKVLNQAVKRNAERFPSDFMFQLTDAEKTEVVTNCDHLASIIGAWPNLPEPIRAAILTMVQATGKRQ